MAAIGTKEAAKGRWREILPALGIPANLLNGKGHPCPFCGGRDRFTFNDKDGRGMFYCRGCEPSSGDGFELLKRFHSWTYRRAADAIDEIISNLPAPKPKIQRTVHWTDIAQLWRTMRPIVTDDPAGSYLRQRGIDLAVWPKALRYIPKWKHSPTQQFVPCLMALFRTADGKLGTIHRTYLADVTPRRMFLPGGVPQGGAIRLFDVDKCMGVAEGIETALSASLLYRLPVWACCNQGLLRQWQPPEGCTHVTVFGDSDSSFVGQAAAYELAWRLARDGYHVAVKIPDVLDWDWNDVIKNEIETERYPTRDLSELRMQHRDISTGSAGKSLSAA